MNKRTLKTALKKATHCFIQHNGWTCGTCFFGLSDKLQNADWQALLLFRGDSKREDLDNLPQNTEESLKKILTIAEYTREEKYQKGNKNEESK